MLTWCTDAYRRNSDSMISHNETFRTEMCTWDVKQLQYWICVIGLFRSRPIWNNKELNQLPHWNDKGFNCLISLYELPIHSLPTLLRGNKGLKFLSPVLHRWVWQPQHVSPEYIKGLKGAVSYRFSQGLLTLMCNNSELKADINFFFFLLRRQTS